MMRMLPHLPDERVCERCTTHLAREWRTVLSTTSAVCDECALRIDLTVAQSAVERVPVLAERLDMLLADETLTEAQAAQVLEVDEAEVQGYVDRHWMHRGSGRAKQVSEADVAQAAELLGVPVADVRALLTREGDADHRLRAHVVHAAAERLGKVRDASRASA